MGLLDIVTKGSTDRSVMLRMCDSGDGTPETGVTSATGGIDLWYRRQGAAKTSVTEVDLSALTDAHSDGGILHIDDGEYRVDLPDAAFATGANFVDVGWSATGMIGFGGRVRLVNFDLETATQSVNMTQISGDSTAADKLEAWMDGATTNTVASGSTTTNVNTDLTEATDDHYNGMVIVFTSGACAGQSRMITDYNGTTKALTVFPALTDTPSAVGPDAFIIAPVTSFANLRSIADAAVSTTTAQLGVNAVQAGGTAWGSGAITAASIATDAIGSDELAASAVSKIWTSTLTESYAADAAEFTGAQALYEICQNIIEFAISGTTKTTKKRDGSTTAKTYTLDSAVNPTSITGTT